MERIHRRIQLGVIILKKQVILKIQTIFSRLVKCSAFFSDASFIDPLEPEYQYSMINGSIYKLVNGVLIETPTVDAKRYFQLDPEATGGLYYEHEKSQRGMYLNASGVFSAKIVDGKIVHTLPEPLCTDFEELTADGSPSHPNPYCNFTQDVYDPYRYKSELYNQRI